MSVLRVGSSRLESAFRLQMTVCLSLNGGSYFEAKVSGFIRDLEISVSLFLPVSIHSLAVLTLACDARSQHRSGLIL